MEKKLEEMSINELFSFKENVKNLADYYTQKLGQYGINDINMYYNSLNEEEKRIIETRLKTIRLYQEIINIIEDRMKFYYDK